MTKIIQNIVHQIVDEHTCERFVIKFNKRGAPVWAHVRGKRYWICPIHVSLKL